MIEAKVLPFESFHVVDDFDGLVGGVVSSKVNPGGQGVVADFEDETVWLDERHGLLKRKMKKKKLRVSNAARRLV